MACELTAVRLAAETHATAAPDHDFRVSMIYDILIGGGKLSR